MSIMHGIQHDRVAVITTPAIALTSFIVTQNIGQSLLLAGTCFVSQYYLSPDLDLANSRPTKRWGLLRSIWTPYQKLIGGHKPRTRNFWSHCLGLGISLRVLYLLCLVLPIFIFVDFDFEVSNTVLKSVAIGLVAGEFIHLIGDWLYSSLKRLS